MRRKNYKGMVFGSLTAMEFAERKNGTTYWRFSCECGNENHVASIGAVVRQAKISKLPNSPSCGCVRKSGTRLVHGYARTGKAHKMYSVYHAMISRCYKKTNPSYHMYGGRGVIVCDEWLDSFDSFYGWAISNGWSPGLSLDKDILSKELGITPPVYSPETCKWITQGENTRVANSRANYENHDGIKISPALALEIFEVYSRTSHSYETLAEEYGVSSSAIGSIILEIKNGGN